MSYRMMRLLGIHPMNEAATDGGDGGSAPAAAPAPAPAEAPAAAPAASEAPAAAQPTSVLGDDPDAPKPEADKATEGEEKPAVVPEKYEAFTLPDGVELDPNALPLVEGLFKELGLPQDKAQAVLDKLLEIDQARQPTPEQRQQAQQQYVTQLNQEWEKECRALEGLGGENFEASRKVALGVITKFATPELRELLTHSALGSNPHFFKFIHSIGSRMSEDTMEHGGAPAVGQKGIAERLWPSQS